MYPKLSAQFPQVGFLALRFWHVLPFLGKHSIERELEETISGVYSQQSDNWWAGAEAVTTLASGGLSTATKVVGTTASGLSLAAEKFAHMRCKCLWCSSVWAWLYGRPTLRWPWQTLATSQMIGRTIGHLGSKYKAYRASQTGNVDIRSGLKRPS